MAPARARGECVDQSPAGRAALLLTHPIRAWIVAHAMQHGTLTLRDVLREWPFHDENAAYRNLMALCQAGWLVPSPRGQPGTRQVITYSLGDVSPLRALHAELTTLLALSPAPEVPDEADR